MPAQRPAIPEVIEERPGGLGTFGGVFTPSILTILGVIMYLRLGWVVGNAGLVGTLLIVTLASGITFLTALSVAQIATDRVVRVGGAYYMISRSLGIETGGAVGLPLYFAQALSVALYTIGFAESLALTFPVLDERLTALVTTVLVALLALQSARAAIRAQYVIMGAIGLSLVALLAGDPVAGSAPMGFLGEPVEGAAPFWTVFAVFFPAVTGIMAGVNMSGDLAEPSRSIPKGTLAAVGVGYLIYMALPVLLVLRASAEDLVADPLVMERISIWGNAILLGVWGASLSSAVGSILGAPRVLQALARDGVLPRWLKVLGSGSGPEDEPKVGTAVTLGVALAAVALGNLNAIAPVLSMFFLTTYLVLNVVAGVERFLNSPSFRPAFRVHWSFSLLGALGCLGVMLLINPLATGAAGVAILAIYLWLERQELEATWGDVRSGIWMQLVRAGLKRAERSPDAKNWRPHLLVLSGAPTRRWSLVELATGLTHNRGLVTLATVLPEGVRDAAQRRRMEDTIREYLAPRGVEAMVRVLAAPSPYTGARMLAEAYGLGVLAPNTLLLGASQEPESRDAYCDMITAFHEGGQNVVILRENAGEGSRGGFGNRARIDVWWGGLQQNGGLMMVLAHLLHSSAAWHRAEVRVKLRLPSAAAAEAARTNLETVLRQMRIDARPEVLVADERPFHRVLEESSWDADLVFLGMARPGQGFREYYETLSSWGEGLPTTAFVLAAEGARFNELLLEGSTSGGARGGKGSGRSGSQGTASGSANGGGGPATP